MHYHQEKVLSPPGESFAVELEVGPVLDCVFHQHPEWELTLIESGFGCRFIGESFEPFAAGDLVLVGGMVPHHYLSSAPDSTGPEWSKVRVVKFRRAFCGEEFFALPEMAGVTRMLRDAECGLHFPAETVEAVLELYRKLYLDRGSARLLDFLNILRILSESPARKLNPVSAAGETPPPDERLNRVLHRIHRNLEKNRPVTLAAAAEAACMTPPAFSKYFHLATRKRFIDYVTELKLNRAALQLIHSRRAVLEIASDSGFANLSNFNRQFLRAKGMTPREYRARFGHGAL